MFQQKNITDDITLKLDSSHTATALSIGFKKALNTLDYKILTHILERGGILKDALSWFNDYLKDRP